MITRRRYRPTALKPLRSTLLPHLLLASCLEAYPRVPFMLPVCRMIQQVHRRELAGAMPYHGAEVVDISSSKGALIVACLAAAVLNLFSLKIISFMWGCRKALLVRARGAEFAVFQGLSLLVSLDVMLIQLLVHMAGGRVSCKAANFVFSCAWANNGVLLPMR